jgi:hypothetical protein
MMLNFAYGELFTNRQSGEAAWGLGQEIAARNLRWLTTIIALPVASLSGDGDTIDEEGFSL